MSKEEMERVQTEVSALISKWGVEGVNVEIVIAILTGAVVRLSKGNGRSLDSIMGIIQTVYPLV